MNKQAHKNDQIIPKNIDNLYSQHLFCVKQKKKVFLLWQQNVLIPEFRQSRQSALVFVFSPIIYQISLRVFKPRMFNNAATGLGIMIGTFVNFQNKYSQDINELVKKDSKVANQIRQCMMDVAYFEKVEDPSKYARDVIINRSTKTLQSS